MPIGYNIIIIIFHSIGLIHIVTSQALVNYNDAVSVCVYLMVIKLWGIFIVPIPTGILWSSFHRPVSFIAEVACTIMKDLCPAFQTASQKIAIDAFFNYTTINISS